VCLADVVQLSSPGSVGGRAGPVSRVYLLHGYSDDHQTWLLQSRLLVYLQGLPLIVVMPDGDTASTADAQEGDPYEQHFLKEVMGIVEGCFQAQQGARARCIGGPVMGGFGAMMLGLKHPDLFASIGAHSSAFDAARRTLGWEPIRSDLRRIMGPASRPTSTGFGYEPFRAGRKGGPEDSSPRSTLTGRGRRAAAVQSRLRGAPHELKLPHDYREFPGSP